MSDNLVYTSFQEVNDSTARGKGSGSYPVSEMIENGFGFVTACYSDIEIDRSYGWQTGIRTTMQDILEIAPREWSAIGAWAWGLSRIVDYLEKDKDVDAGKVAVFGHSRLGKTALWAGASDPRFGIVISNCSGEGGAALARRWFGETVKPINEHFPHWFVDAYKGYIHHVFDLPVDQHELIALIAPRSVYIGTAVEDLWSDPKGQFLAGWHAGEVYHLFGKKGLATSMMPPVEQPIGNTIHFHIRKGGHGLRQYDWEQYLKFAAEQWDIKN